MAEVANEMDTEYEGGTSCTIWVIIGIIFLAMFLSYGKHLYNQGSSGIASKLKDPEEAVFAFIEAVNDVKQGKPKSAANLLQCVTKDDRKWYEKNVTNIYNARAKGFTDFIGYKSGSTVEEGYVAINIIASGCPNRTDSKVTNKRIDAKSASITVEQGTAYGYSIPYTIDLKKEGRYWKVNGFCGMRKDLEREF